MCSEEAEAAIYLSLCKDIVDEMIIFLRIEGKSINDIANELEMNKSTVSRRLKRLKNLGFEDSYNVIERGKLHSLVIGTIGEYVVHKALNLANVAHEWLGSKVGNHPDFELFEARKKWLELKNFRQGHYITRSEAERDIVSRFEKCTDGEKLLLITSGVEIKRDAWEVLKKNKIRVYRIGSQITDCKLVTILRVLFRLKRLGIIANLLAPSFTMINEKLNEIDDLNVAKCRFKEGVEHEGG